MGGRPGSGPFASLHWEHTEQGARQSRFCIPGAPSPFWFLVIECFLGESGFLINYIFNPPLLSECLCCSSLVLYSLQPRSKLKEICSNVLCDNRPLFVLILTGMPVYSPCASLNCSSKSLPSGLCWMGLPCPPLGPGLRSDLPVYTPFCRCCLPRGPHLALEPGRAFLVLSVPQSSQAIGEHAPRVRLICLRWPRRGLLWAAQLQGCPHLHRAGPSPGRLSRSIATGLMLWAMLPAHFSDRTSMEQTMRGTSMHLI